MPTASSTCHCRTCHAKMLLSCKQAHAMQRSTCHAKKHMPCRDACVMHVWWALHCSSLTPWNAATLGDYAPTLLVCPHTRVCVVNAAAFECCLHDHILQATTLLFCCDLNNIISHNCDISDTKQVYVCNLQLSLLGLFPHTQLQQMMADNNKAYLFMEILPV